MNEIEETWWTLNSKELTPPTKEELTRVREYIDKEREAMKLALEKIKKLQRKQDVSNT